MTKIECGRCRKYTCHVQHNYLGKYPGLLGNGSIMGTFGEPEWVDPSNTMFPRAVRRYVYYGRL